MAGGVSMNLCFGAAPALVASIAIAIVRPPPTT